MARRAFRGRRVKRKTHWLAAMTPECPTRVPISDCQDVSPQLSLFQLIENFGNLVPGQVGSAGDEETLVRLVGELTVSCFVSNVTANGVIALQVDVPMGIYLSDEDENGNVVPLSPAAIVDQESKDWLWRHLVSFHSLTRDPPQAGNAMATQTFECKTIPIDIRVMRKIRPRELILYSIEPTFDEIAGSEISSPTVSIQGNIRALLMSA